MSTKDRKEREKENRRETILQAAEAVMMANGLHGLSIDLIAQETELAKGTIYLYFKSKEEILGILTVKSRHILYNEFEKIAATPAAPIEKLHQIIKANYTFYKTNPLYYDLVSLYEANSQLTETEEMYQWSNNITQLVTNIVVQAQKDGVLNQSINPLHFTTCMWGMTVGILQLIKVRGAILKEKLGVSEEDMLATFLEIFENGIRK